MSDSSQKSSSETLHFIDQKVKQDFDDKKTVLSFDEYLQLLAQNPQSQLRNSSQYVVDMMDYYGKEPSESSKDKDFHFNIFDQKSEGAEIALMGHEQVQTKVYQTLKSFTRQKTNNRMILLHGPNGSAKTTLTHAIMRGVESYSNKSEGACYTFNWVFPIEKLSKSSIGIQNYDSNDTNIHSFAKLTADEISATLPSSLKDHPFLLIPKEQRLKLLKELLGEEQATEVWAKLPAYFTNGSLNHRCKQIFDALLSSYNGDYKKVLMHIQVKRFFYSQRYRDGLVTVEPQMHVDAHYQQLTLDKNISNLPASVQGLNLYSLSGDLIDGNRGIIEFSDLLKRPVDTFKYLLSACETGAVNLGPSIIYLDCVMIGSTNEVQMDAFKEYPDFNSFKARLELIRVPYLLSMQKEAKIYDQLLDEINHDKPLAPHLSWTLALWAILSRLKKPNSINYPPNISGIVSGLSPLDKAKLYSNGDLPLKLSPEERLLLKNNIEKIKNEYTNIPYYEGRIGASVREIKSILFDSIHNDQFPCLSPLSVLREMKEFIKNKSEHDFLEQDIKDGFHDANEFIKIVRNEYLEIIDREVRDSIGLYDPQQWEVFIKKYVYHVSLFLKNEKYKNPTTGEMLNPDQTLIDEFEKITSAPKSEKDLEQFRNNIISRVGAWSLDNPKEKVHYQNVFPEYWAKLEKHYYESQKSKLTKMHNALLIFKEKDTKQVHDEGYELAKQTLTNMKSKQGYCNNCAKEVINFLMKERY